MQSHLTQLNQHITKIKAQLPTFPAGTLLCKKNGKNWQWIHLNNKQESYIRKSRRNFAEQLALKKYLTFLLKDLEADQKATELYLKKYKSVTGKAEQFLSASSEYRTLLQAYFQLPEDQQNWAAAPYEKNQKYPEHLIHKSSSGNLLRSKSEVIIDTLLYMHKIPFRYECALSLNSLIFPYESISIYPDFTILHPRTGKIYYWEHFGKMDDPAYAQKTAQKLQLYIANQIIPSINLITTYETQTEPLTSELVEKILNYYFSSSNP